MFGKDRLRTLHDGASLVNHSHDQNPDGLCKHCKKQSAECTTPGCLTLVVRVKSDSSSMCRKCQSDAHHARRDEKTLQVRAEKRRKLEETADANPSAALSAWT